ncbi:tetratricopeptide repeat protein [Desulfohalovibrio reitneri]|uniref:tetratricopeptide repeat protein n=1 Tax=Desulfohalovibrio reitneri TaxID=1307759 RepID=UPI0004A7799A|nr:tetratricopeptide repeat protein [Desulfohalovibrio reitneri]
MPLNNPAKDIKTHIGKAKALMNKHQAVKCMAELLSAIKLQLTSGRQIMGPDRIEIEYSLGELMTGLNAFPELHPYLDQPLEYKKGAERDAYQRLATVLRSILEDMKNGGGEDDEEAREAERRRKALLEKMEEYLLKGDQMQASGMVRKLLEESDGDSYVLMDVAEKFYKARQYESVLTYALEAVKKNPQEMRAYKLAINSYRFLKEYEKALELFKQAISVFGHHPNIYINMTRLFWEWGKPQQARKTACMTLKLDPDNEEAAKFLAAIDQGGEGSEAPLEAENGAEAVAGASEENSG